MGEGEFLPPFRFYRLIQFIQLRDFRDFNYKQVGVY